MTNKRRFGDLGEEYAVGLLKKNGYKIIDRNFRTKFGEIDMVALQDDNLVFVEVKTRWSKKYGAPEEAVTPRKIARIKRAAQIYMWENKNLPKKLRIDIVAIEIRENIVISSKIIRTY